MAKPTIYGYKTLDAVSAAVAQTSPATVVGQMDKLTFQCKFTQAATGTFLVEAKSEKIDGTPGTWYALDFGGPMTVTAETDVIFNLNELPFSHVRIGWSGHAGNTGTLTVTVSAKAVGA